MPAAAEAPALDLKQVVLSNSTFGPGEIDRIVGSINTDPLQFGVLRDSVQELETREDRSPATNVRLGVCYYILGKYRLAADTLANADGGALARFYLGKSQFALERYDEAKSGYDSAKKAGYRKELCDLAVAETQRASGNAKAALATLDHLSGAVEQTADYLYQRGACVSALGGNTAEVIALYERAVEADGNHVGALFGLALENDRYGNDDAALRFYQRSAHASPRMSPRS
jgi:DNA-directed RNA polymerase subunit alpha